jgi:hypothetical protein
MGTYIPANLNAQARGQPIVSNRSHRGKTRAKATKRYWPEARKVNLPKLDSLNYTMCD